MGNAFTWWAIVPTLVGGLLSACSAVGMFYLAQRTERKKRQKESRSRLALSAFDGFRKLLEVSNGLENIKLHIDDAFRSAKTNGGAHLEPYIKVMPFVGARMSYKDMTAEEIYFLTKIKDAELISELDLIFRRARNNETVVEKYSEMRQEINNFMESRVGSDITMDGTLVSGSINATDKVILDLRGGTLNNVLGTLITHLEADCVKARDLCLRYLKAAQTEYGDDFPKVKLEWAR